MSGPADYSVTEWPSFGGLAVPVGDDWTVMMVEPQREWKCALYRPDGSKAHEFTTTAIHRDLAIGLAYNHALRWREEHPE